MAERIDGAIGLGGAEEARAAERGQDARGGRRAEPPDAEAARHRLATREVERDLGAAARIDGEDCERVSAEGLEGVVRRGGCVRERGTGR